ncbi:MAG: site-specific DNA-methyltransferase, partial [Dehalococcoidales bacterium]|nr:site-specific DNA-methyltransferase [Dehalococcoidales bacterium]
MLYYDNGTVQLYNGDCRNMAEIPDESIQCCVTSPPYWGLRDYGVEGQIGLEQTPEEYVAQLISVFKEVWRVLRKDGVLWLNLGDSFYGSWQNYGGGNRGAGKQRPIIKGSNAQNPVWEGLEESRPASTLPHSVLKPKDLVGIPWRCAFALQSDGWYLRSDVIWSKPNPMPESVTDRPTKSHEYLFLMAKSQRYYYDQEAIKERCVWDLEGNGTQKRKERQKEGLKSNPSSSKNGIRQSGKNEELGKRTYDGFNERWDTKEAEGQVVTSRNRRSVWTIATRPFNDWGYDYSSSDYVGDDGKPYKVSQDCPIHGQHHGKGTQKRDVCDEQQGHVQSDTSGNAKNPDQALESESVSIPGPSGEAPTDGNANGQTFGSMGGSRTSCQDKGRIQIPDHIADIQTTPVSNSDCSPHGCSQIAMQHSNQSRKTGRVLVTSSPCNASAESVSHTGDKLSPPLTAGLGDHISENNNGEDSALSERVINPLAGNLCHTVHISHSHYKCTCKISQLSHFATFPEDLVEPCILAGSKAGDTILDPFAGSGTALWVAQRLGRKAIGYEMKEDYCKLAIKRMPQLAMALN